MRKVIFNLKPGRMKGQETAEEKLAVFEEYKKQLIEDGEEIVKETDNGRYIELELK